MIGHRALLAENHRTRDESDADPRAADAERDVRQRAPAGRRGAPAVRARTRGGTARGVILGRGLRARFLVDRGTTKMHEFALQAMKELPYARWREYEPEEALRFYALRLHESGWIRTSPKKIIADGTDWRILRELKRELKG